MTTRAPDIVESLKPETVESIQELMQALRDSTTYHTEAADKIDDDVVKEAFMMIAAQRREMQDEIGSLLMEAQQKPAENGTFLGSLRTIWTSFRAGLNSGDAKVVLIEAERAEDVIVDKFKNILPDAAGSPVNVMLLKHFETVKVGHDRVLALRNAYQNS